MNTYRPFIVIGIVLLVAAAGTALLLESNKRVSSRNDDPQASDSNNAIPPKKIVILEEYGDYQCPSCAQLHPTLKKLKQEYAANLTFIFHNMPLTMLHRNALAAAQAAEAARIQDHFWEMHDLLYENQDLWNNDVNPRSIFIKFAADLGLNTAQFTSDLDSKQIQMRIEADEDSAAQHGVDGTPTIFIDGRKLRDELTTPDGVRQAVEMKLRGGTPGSP